MPSDQPRWLTQILTELDARDAREKAPYSAVFASHASLSRRVGTLNRRIVELEAALQAVQKEYGEAQRGLTLAREVGSEESVKRALDMPKELEQLKEERNNLYRLQATNAQRVVELSDAKKGLEAELAGKVAECTTLQSSVQSLQSKLQDKDNLLAEKDRAIQILRDEHSAISLELGQKEEKLAKLEKENAEVVQRYLELKNDMANKMNEANQILEDALRAKETSSRSPSSGRLSPSSANSSAVDLTRRKGSFSVLPTQPIRKLTGHKGDTNSLAVSPDGRLFATGSDDRVVIIWDASTGAAKAQLQGSGAGIVSLGFSYANDMVIAGANDNVAKVWTLATGRMKHTLTGHSGKVFAAKFTVENKVVTGSHDRTLKVWDLARGYCTKNVFTLSSCNDIALVDDGGHVVASGHLDNSVRIWDMATGKTVKELTGLHSEQVVSVEISEDRTQLLSLSRDNTMRLIDIRTFEPLATFSADTFRVPVNLASAALSADSRYAVAGSVDGGVYFWNTTTGNVDTVLRGHMAPVCSVAWSPLGGARVYSMDTKRGMVIWGGAGESVAVG